MQRMGEKKKVKYVEMATGHHNGVLMDIYSHSKAALASAMTETISHDGTEESLGMYEYGSGCIYKNSTSAYTKNGFAFPEKSSVVMEIANCQRIYTSHGQGPRHQDT